MTSLQQQNDGYPEGYSDLAEPDVISERSVFDCLNISNGYSGSDGNILNRPFAPAPDCGGRQRAVLDVSDNLLRKILVAVRAEFLIAHDRILRRSNARHPTRDA